jgi:drug/metabolite transporter (DMT)-like permease
MVVTADLQLSQGAALALLGAVGMALDTILVYYYTKIRTTQTVPFVLAQFFTLAATTSVGALVWDYPRYGPPVWSYNVIFAIFYLAVGASVLAFYLQNKFQQETTPDRTALIYTLEPLVAAVLAYQIMDQKFEAHMYAGAALILIGIGGSEYVAARLARRESSSLITRESSSVLTTAP